MSRGCDIVFIMEDENHVMYRGFPGFEFPRLNKSSGIRKSLRSVIP